MGLKGPRRMTALLPPLEGEPWPADTVRALWRERARCRRARAR